MGYWTITDVDADIADRADALHNNGWRSDDRDEIVLIFGLSEDDADRVIECLRTIEEDDE